ncbi:hypothetical protein CPS91_004363 [Salmonella enterica subsp. enterica]|nr:hypothetical protein [Salmonella enterica subsp. enterica]EDN7307235.1 hypothetical protein [Salmonella enterica subsp. enterica]EDQ3366029.1 hypothetical protein [Salmonella enterica subsp. enterica]EDR5096808.1 hypothetical protein [Salmonella enterica subsp. enterica]EDS2029712.1 hypothetical protein [Salmonella enterica subsp. enterica]
MIEKLTEKNTVALVKFLAENKTFLFHASLFMALASYLMLTYLPDNIKYSLGVLICSYVSISVFKRLIYISTKKEVQKYRVYKNGKEIR